ncbi:MAG TPA: hypothetical protein DHI91_00085 [Candidatus Portnoybacteria bacterium]|nr:hypothetical protein [Candidatus Portnoybacteria bacterium]
MVKFDSRLAHDISVARGRHIFVLLFIMKNRALIIVCAVIVLALAGAGIFTLTKKQAGVFKKLFSVPKTTLTPSPTASSTAEELAALRQELEKLKNQPPQIIYKTDLTPASPSPTPNLKSKEELNKAQQKISSLEQQLQQLQTQGSQASSQTSDADLIKSWQASDRVVQIACQDKLTGSWQLGSGVLVSSDGKILTNQHVVKPSFGILLPDYCLALFAKDYEAATQSYKREYRAPIVGFFEGRDAALLKIQDIVYKDSSGQIQNAPIVSSFQFFRPASGTPQIGDSVYVIGFPESAGFSFSVTKGIISNFVPNEVYFGTDAQIDRGNSGGAAINSAGQLIGLPTYKFISSGDYRGYILDIHSIKLDI